MDKDIYLGLAAELYEKGTWNKDTFIKKVTLYAKESKIDEKSINEYIRRVTNEKEYSVEEKRNFLSVLTIDGHELKYGDIVQIMSEENVVKFYDMEAALLSSDKISAYHSLAKVKNKNNNDKKENNDSVPAEIVEKKSRIDVERILNDDYEAEYLLGKTEKDSDELFEELINIVKPEQFNNIVESLGKKLGQSYSRAFAIEWAKKHSDEMNKIETNNQKSEERTIGNEENNDLIQEPEVIDSYENNSSEKEQVIPSLNFDEEDIAQTEEEFKNQAKNISEPEKDSNVTIVSASKERIENLKSNKGKIINYFLKTAIVITSLTLLTAPSAITLIGGYLIYANRIKSGKYNPENPVGKAIKSGVEKIMYMGMTKKEIENERGKTR